MNSAVQERLRQALACFVSAYEASPELIAEQRGWSPTIALAASDAPARVVVSLDDGRVARAAAETSPPTLEITGDLDTLCDVLALRRDPNEPYLFGELVVVGAEADFVRLDYIASRLCPR
jgi:putative sterol carrier protein